MKKSVKNATLALVVLVVCTLAGEKAFAQFTNSFAPSNGQGKILISSTINGIDTVKFAKIVCVTEASLSPSFVSIVADQYDTFGNNKIKITNNIILSVSITNYTTYYIRQVVYGCNVAGKIIDTANSVFFIPILVTPKFQAPSFKLGKTIDDSHQPQIPVTYNSGFDSAEITGKISYGDTVMAYPKNIPISFGKVIGNNKTINVILPWMPVEYLYSYQLKIKNSVGDTISITVKGMTTPDGGPASVSSPYNLSSSNESVTFYVDVVTSGLITREVSYIGLSPTDTALDSVVSILPGNNGATSVKKEFRNLESSTNYYVWTSVANNQNSFPSLSIRKLIQTDDKISVFNIKIDSTESIGPSTQRCFINVTVPLGNKGNVYILYSKFSDPNFVDGTSVTVKDNIEPGVHTLKFDIPSLKEGTVYLFTLFGNDSLYTKIIKPGTVIDTFTFYPSLEVSVQEPGKKNEVEIKVYPNPATEYIQTNHNLPYIIFDNNGKAVRTGTSSKIEVSNLPSGVYIFKNELGASQFIKQ